MRVLFLFRIKCVVVNMLKNKPIDLQLKVIFKQNDLKFIKHMTGKHIAANHKKYCEKKFHFESGWK